MKLNREKLEEYLNLPSTSPWRVDLAPFLEGDGSYSAKNTKKTCVFQFIKDGMRCAAPAQRISEVTKITVTAMELGALSSAIEEATERCLRRITAADVLFGLLGYAFAPIAMTRYVSPWLAEVAVFFSPVFRERVTDDNGKVLRPLQPLEMDSPEELT